MFGYLHAPNLVEVDEGKNWRNLVMEVMKEEDTVWQKEDDMQNPQHPPVQIRLRSPALPIPHLSRQAQRDVCVPPASHHLEK